MSEEIKNMGSINVDCDVLLHQLQLSDNSHRNCNQPSSFSNYPNNHMQLKNTSENHKHHEISKKYPATPMQNTYLKENSMIHAFDDGLQRNPLYENIGFNSNSMGKYNYTSNLIAQPQSPIKESHPVIMNSQASDYVLMKPAINRKFAHTPVLEMDNNPIYENLIPQTG